MDKIAKQLKAYIDTHPFGPGDSDCKTVLDQRYQAYVQRKETIERVFTDAKGKHAMRYTHRRGLAAVTRWVRLKYAAMNLKKLANWSWNNSFFSRILLIFSPKYTKTPVFT